MSKIILSYVFKTSLSELRSAIVEDNTDRICRILDIDHSCLRKPIDSDGNTALLLAIQYGSPLTVRLLLEQGALPDQQNANNFQTPLALIASKEYEDYNSYQAQKSLQMAETLIDHGAYVDKPAQYTYKDNNNEDYEGKETPLLTAVRKKNLPLAKLLIDRKANVNYVERHSQIRPIHYAISNGDEKMFDLLENAGALCCSLLTYDENTLLHWFCCKTENDEHVSLLNKLIEKGCDINAQNCDGETPLILAVKYNMINTSRMLLKNGAITNQCDHHGNQAIDLSIPGSDCSRLLLRTTNDNKCELNTESHSNAKSNKSVVWKRRIHKERRFSIEMGNINNDETKFESAPPTCTNEDEKSNRSSNPSFFPMRRTNSDELHDKYERIREKLLHSSQRRRASRKFIKTKTDPINIEDQSPS